MEWFYKILKYKLLSIFSIFFVSVLQAQEYNDLCDSLKQATEMLSYHPDNIDLRLKKAAWNVQLEQWQYAKDEYDYVLNLQPNNVAGLYFRAFVNEKLGRYNFARFDYENLLREVPRYFAGWLGLALLNEKDNHYTDAMNQINYLVHCYPDSAVAYAARAGMEKNRGLYELALYDFSEAIQRNTNNKDYLLNRVEVYIKLGRKDEAKADLDTLVALGIPRTALKHWYKCL